MADLDPVRENTVPKRPEPSQESGAGGGVRAYYELTKPGIAAFVVITAGVSFYVAAGGQPAWIPLLHTLLGTLLGTAGSLALNQFAEREVDARMDRTRGRPIPSGRLAAGSALVFGLVLLAGGTGYLWATVGVLPAALTLGAAACYNLVYTPLKSRTYAATFAGAIPGAMPALIGWSAQAGSVGLGALVLFGIAFLWQIPHVLALAWLLKEDYAKAGFFLAPPADGAGRVIGGHMVLYCAALLPVSLFLTPLGLTGTVYLFGALVLGGVFLWGAVLARREMSRRSVRRVFLASLLYQPLLLGLMVIDTVRV